MKKIKQIVFSKPNVAEYLEVGHLDLTNIGEREVVVKTEFSAISAGTERANFVGESKVSVIKDAVTPFPRTVGYSSTGTVVYVGSGVKKVKSGDRVALFWSKHKNYNIVSEDNVVKLPDSVPFDAGAFAFISVFPLGAIRKVNLELGESLMVMGLGVLGQIAVMLARAGGAYPVIACDINASRRAEALKNGADYAFDPTASDFISSVRAVTDGMGVKTAIEVTGVGAGLDETLDCTARFGRVALLGCTRSSDFSIDYYGKVHGPGITLVGAHTLARPTVESYPHYFTHEDDMKTVVNLCGSGRLPLENLIKEIVKPVDAQAVFTRLVSDRDFPIGVLFDWREE